MIGLFDEANIALPEQYKELLEIGTGTGLAIAFLLDGMYVKSKLVSVDKDARSLSVAKRILGADERIQFICHDGTAFITQQFPRSFDLIFADAWPGKFERLNENSQPREVGRFLYR